MTQPTSIRTTGIATKVATMTAEATSMARVARLDCGPSRRSHRRKLPGSVSMVILMAGLLSGIVPSPYVVPATFIVPQEGEGSGQ